MILSERFYTTQVYRLSQKLKKCSKKYSPVFLCDLQYFLLMLPKQESFFLTTERAGQEGSGRSIQETTSSQILPSMPTLPVLSRFFLNPRTKVLGPPTKRTHTFLGQLGSPLQKLIQIHFREEQTNICPRQAVWIPELPNSPIPFQLAISLHKSTGPITHI